MPELSVTAREHRWEEKKGKARVEGVEEARGASEETKEREGSANVDLQVEMDWKSKRRLRRDKQRDSCLF